MESKAGPLLGLIQPKLGLSCRSASSPVLILPLPINVSLGLCIAAAPDSADSVQFAELQVKQLNL